MKTFVLDVPKELIAGRLADGVSFCAVGLLCRDVLNMEPVKMSVGIMAGELSFLGSEDGSLWGLLVEKMGTRREWLGVLASRNNAEPDPQKRPALLKATLRELERGGEVEFLFLDELSSEVRKQPQEELVRC